MKPGAAAGIGQFYKEVFGAPYTLAQDMNAATVRVKVGPKQCLIFRETTEKFRNMMGTTSPCTSPTSRVRTRS